VEIATVPIMVSMGNIVFIKPSEFRLFGKEGGGRAVEEAAK
jgi:hypothetical protein